jgi:hypothetical protein
MLVPTASISSDPACRFVALFANVILTFSISHLSKMPQNGKGMTAQEHHAHTACNQQSTTEEMPMRVEWQESGGVRA